MLAHLQQWPARVQEAGLPLAGLCETRPGDHITPKTTEEQTEVPFTPQKPGKSESCGEDLIPMPQRGNSEPVRRLVH